MATGCAVVAPRVGGIEEIITNEHDGLLVDPCDPDALAAALLRLLLDQPSCAAASGNEARGRSTADSTPNGHLSETVAAYREAIAPRVTVAAGSPRRPTW